jgi:serine/threonine protein kinase
VSRMHAECPSHHAHRPASDSEIKSKSNTPGNPAAPPGLHGQRTPCGSAIFDVGRGYTIRKLIGQGAFGCVVAAERSNGEKVAIKKVANTSHDKTAAKRLLRELHFLRHLRGHPNVVSVEDVIVRQNKADVYIVTELMEADLEQIIKSSQVLSTEHVRCLIFQLLNGLRYMHSAGIVHRDLKPANLVVDSQCRLKICDLGLSRHISDSLAVPEGEDAKFTDYVVTRWYRAPELLMGSKRYTKKVDTWAAGCILGELMGRRPIFSGDDTSDMLVKICGRMGSPSVDEVYMLTDQEAARRFVLSIPHKPGRTLAEILPDSDPAGLALMAHLLQWTPLKRASVEEALESPFLRDLSEPPRSLSTDHRELAAISSGNLEPLLVLDLICLECCVWRSSDEHYRVSVSPAMPAISGSEHLGRGGGRVCGGGASSDCVMPDLDYTYCASAKGAALHTPATRGGTQTLVRCSCGQQFHGGLHFLSHLEDVKERKELGQSEALAEGSMKWEMAPAPPVADAVC